MRGTVSGCALDAQSLFDEALLSFDRALVLQPDESEYWHARADTEYNAGRIAESLQSYVRVVTLDAENKDAWMDLAETRLEAGLARRGA